MNDAASMDPLEKAWAEAAAMDDTLQTQLDFFVAASRRIEPEVHLAYDRMIERVTRAGGGACAPAVGDMLPDALLCDQGGRLVSLSSLCAQSALVVSFNRGHWCPFCRLQLNALKRAGSKFAASGARIVSIVPETAEYSCRMIEMNDLPFPVLSDVDHAFAMELGLATWMGEEIETLYAAGGLDLARFQGGRSGLLPIPATFVLAQGGRVLARFVEPDFQKRMALDAIGAALIGHTRS